MPCRNFCMFYGNVPSRTYISVGALSIMLKSLIPSIETISSKYLIVFAPFTETPEYFNAILAAVCIPTTFATYSGHFNRYWDCDYIHVAQFHLFHIASLSYFFWRYFLIYFCYDFLISFINSCHFPVLRYTVLWQTPYFSDFSLYFVMIILWDYHLFWRLTILVAFY